VILPIPLTHRALKGILVPMDLKELLKEKRERILEEAKPL
jgi:hypothetical protein